MASIVRHVTFDCADAYRLGGFWAQVLNASLADDDGPGDSEALLETEGVTLLFVAVAEPKITKNRVHLDLQPTDRFRRGRAPRAADRGPGHRDPAHTGGTP